MSEALWSGANDIQDVTVKDFRNPLPRVMDAFEPAVEEGFVQPDVSD